LTSANSMLQTAGRGGLGGQSTRDLAAHSVLVEEHRTQRSMLWQLEPLVTSLHRPVSCRPGVVAATHSRARQWCQPGGLAHWIRDYDNAIGIDLDRAPEEFVL